jgi:hypothetical protein
LEPVRETPMPVPAEGTAVFAIKALMPMKLTAMPFPAAGIAEFVTVHFLWFG